MLTYRLNNKHDDQPSTQPVTLVFTRYSVLICTTFQAKLQKPGIHKTDTKKKQVVKSNHYTQSVFTIKEMIKKCKKKGEISPSSLMSCS